MIPRILYQSILISLLLFETAAFAKGQIDTLQVSALRAPVEILTDKWGISHIYAENESDLFFAQGFSAARDRLFQFEMWRRRATGTLAEILGAKALKHDIGIRLFKFRGDLKQELNYYHPRGEAIISAYVQGVNAYIEETRRNPDLLPIEFSLLGILPKKWTPAVVISRHQGLLGNITRELNYGRAVHLLGADKVKDLANFHPGEPNIDLDASIDGSLLLDDILELYNAFRRAPRFEKEDLVSANRTGDTSDMRFVDHLNDFPSIQDRGSNNWIISGGLTDSGYPFMANDPHRAVTVPSLRYWVHLVAPGWNVIGGGEPTIPGVSIGHNEYGAWGLTVFRTDGEDLYVYDTNPDNPNQYRYRGEWEEMQVIQETISIKGASPATVDLKYTRHGPVVYEDETNRKAYAVRAAWMEIGGAPYLASLRMDQAKTWEEFREACSYSHIPGENMIWADKTGTIGWQAVGITPIRKNWTGLVPVPGDGRYEWDGYLPIKARPHVVNPKKGFWATANNNLVTLDYPYRNTVSWNWSDPFRANRINEVLGSGQRHSLSDMIRLQTDYLSLPARTLTPLLKGLRSSDRRTEQARQLLVNWNYLLEKESVPAGIYVAWERHLRNNMRELLVPEQARRWLSVSLSRVIDWLIVPRSEFGDDLNNGRDEFLIESLKDAIEDLSDRLGSNMKNWHLGQPGYGHIRIRHLLSRALDDKLRQQLDLEPLPRGGNSYTVGRTAATFKLIVDTGDWDRAVGMNSPGQSGDPENSHYRDLYKHWAEDKYFPVYYSRRKIETAIDKITVLTKL